MELNKLVFPAPPPSYTHESLNDGSFIDHMEEIPKVIRRGKKQWMVKVKMLYVPKFEMYTYEEQKVNIKQSILNIKAKNAHYYKSSLYHSFKQRPST
jgi:hypothetical protein